MLLVGSRALINYGFERSPKDWDYISTQAEYDQFVKEHEQRIVLITDKKWGHLVYMQGSDPIEIEIVEKRPSTQILMDNLEKWFPSYNGNTAPIYLLYALKMSHRFLKNSPHFLKTMRDIKEIETKYCADWWGKGVIPPFLKEWYEMREKETYNYSHPSLNRKKKDFFVDDFYVYDHDQIHAIVALNELPAFNYFKEDAAEVKCSKDKFFNCDESVRLAAVYEESCVLALERHQIPNDFSPAPEKSFLISLEKVCSGITSGWFRTYAWDNYNKVVDLYHKRGKSNYVDLFKQALESGIIKPQ